MNLNCCEDGTLSGTDPDIITMLSEKLGFNFHYRLETIFSAYAPNGSLTDSLYHSVYKGWSDIGIGQPLPDLGNHPV